MHTKKVGSAGRFGNKYGSKIRVAVAKAEADSRSCHPCPVCLNQKLVRESAGIWTCRKCSTTFAGGAYSPTTAATKIMAGEIAALVEEAPAEEAKKEAAAVAVKANASPEKIIAEEKPKKVKKAAGTAKKKKEGAKAKTKKK